MEPDYEEELQEPAKTWLIKKGYIPKVEVPISNSVADIVAFKKKRRGGEIIAVELKCAKANKRALDRGIRQCDEYLDGADYVYLAATPMLLWKRGIDYFTKQLTKLGVGLLVVDENEVVSILLAPVKSKHIDQEDYDKVLANFTY